MIDEFKPALRTPERPALSTRTVVRHGLEIFAQAIGRKLNMDAQPAQKFIDQYVTENVADEPISLRPLLENAGILRREKRRRLK